MLRKVVKIDENKCNGCGDCIPGCAEGALQIIDGKARLISDLFCDGLGACLGYCPEGAITIEMREAEPYNERKVLDYIIKGGQNVVIAHLKHLQEHGETGYLKEALVYLNELGINVPGEFFEKPAPSQHTHGCPGSAERRFEPESCSSIESSPSQLSHWPVQFHLASPGASHFKNSDLVIAADCTAFAYADFHKDFLKNKSLVIACPKLDSNKQVYLDKLITMLENAGLKSVTVLIMQVPCCGGLAQLAQQAFEITGSSVPLNVTIIGVRGEILKTVQLN